ncbi:MAG: hypothetical protein R2795_08365 [Saprospiraceae bacterium]
MNYSEAQQVFLRMLEQQISQQTPTFVAPQLKRLLALGHSETYAKMLMASVLAYVTGRQIERDEAFNTPLYEQLLARLPQLPQ